MSSLIRPDVLDVARPTLIFFVFDHRYEGGKSLTLVIIKFRIEW